MKEDAMGELCSMYGDEIRIQNFGRKYLKGKDLLEDLDVDGKIILEWILGKRSGKVWIRFMCLRI
jgi:hypothetical protein